MASYTVTRDITQAEAPWLGKPIAAGSIVYKCAEPTYGCVREFAATFSPEGGYPFFELPYDALEVNEEDD